MEKPLHTLKPNIINALFPILFKNLFYSIIVALVLYAISPILGALNIAEYSQRTIIIVLIVFVLMVSVIPLIVKLIILSTTTYYFFKTHVLKEQKFFVINRHSLPYDKIVNMRVNISVWDRICNAGDIILHTAEDKNPDLRLMFIRKPRKIETGLYKMIHKHKAESKTS